MTFGKLPGQLRGLLLGRDPLASQAGKHRPLFPIRQVGCGVSQRPGSLAFAERQPATRSNLPK